MTQWPVGANLHRPSRQSAMVAITFVAGVLKLGNLGVHAVDRGWPLGRRQDTRRS
jgi:hypothetical protein